jgi:hypothetical protein
MRPKITDTKVLNVIKSEFRNAERYSSNVFEDVDRAKMIYDNLFISQNESIIIKGFIQEIKMNKFGFLLYTEKQVCTARYY